MQNNTFSIIKQTEELLYNVIIHVLYDTTVYTLWLNLAEKKYFMSENSMGNLLVINKLKVCFRQMIV